MWLNVNKWIGLWNLKKKKYMSVITFHLKPT